ncbi:crosslink repair DNA glycosylase YcaQ family protein [Leifsonia sp. 2TAF2]|uniref:DNA glycosylase AlkZ-like family protein n=1 Tax=Leifsonia sp. 2TAF2 TaxID=3233009 RepID=UPI003F9A5BF5
MGIVTLDQEEARRIAVRAQRLDAAHPSGGIVPLVEHLTFLQLDPTAAVAPSADLIAFTRLGPSYRPEHLAQAMEEDRALYELKAQDDPVQPPFAMVRPVSDLALTLDRMARGPIHAGWRAWLEANPRFRQDVLDRLRDAGPLLSKDIPDTAQVPWQSSGWTHEKNVTHMLELLQGRGEVAVAGRIGRQRTWDLAERIYPSGIEVVPEAEAAPLRDARRLRALGIARPQLVGDAGIPARIEGSDREWRVDPAGIGLPFAGRTALLSPFDRLIHDRVRTQELFGFEYLLEMYKPAAKRRWGYFALPILHDDRLVGKLDATADRTAGVLRVDAVHEDEPFGPAVGDDVDAAIAELAEWQGLTVERR